MIKPIRRTLKSLPTIRDLTDSHLKKADRQNLTDQSKITTEMIRIGRGHWRNAERNKAVAENDELALQDQTLCDEARVIHKEMERRYGPLAWITFL